MNSFLKQVAARWWWSEISTSVVRFLKNLLLLIRIKSMQLLLLKIFL